MTVLFGFIFLLSLLTVQVPNASASPIDPSIPGIHPRNDASDDELAKPSRLDDLQDDFFSFDPLPNSNSRELEELDDFLSILKSDAQPAHAINHQSNAPLPATKLHADPQHYEQSDDESIEYPHHRKRRRISPDSEETAGLKTTGLDFTELPDASVDDNVDDESAIQIKRRGKY